MNDDNTSYASLSQASEDIYKIVFDNALDGIALADCETKKFMMCNQTLCGMLGYSEEEFLNLGVTDIHPEQNLPYVIEQFEKRVRNEESMSRDIPVQRKDGSVFYADINTASLVIHDKACLLGIFRDITERRLTEQELKDKEALLRVHIDNSFDVIFTLNSQGEFVFVSPAWERHFGYPASDVLGKSFMPVVHPDDVAGCLEYLQRLIVSMQPGTSPPYRVRHADGTWRTFVANGMPYVNSNGDVLYNGVGRDISKSVKLEHYLVEAIVLAGAAKKSRSEFLANISHELVTPLNSIIGFSQILLDGLGGELNDKQREYLGAILQGGERLNEAYADMLQVAGIESGEQQLHQTRFLLKDIMNPSLLSFREKARLQGLSLSLENDAPPETTLEADQGKLRQILFNLIDNAIKFTPQGGAVVVSAKKISCPTDQSDLIEISVTDTGIGIREEDMPSLFKPFQQLESVYTKRFKGTGLGLLLVKKLVELHGGSIQVESEIGKWSRFSFRIPLEQGL